MPTTYSGTTPREYFNSTTSSRPAAAGNRQSGGALPTTKEEQIERLKQLLEMMKNLPQGDVTNEDGDKIVDIEEKLEETKTHSKAPQVATPSPAMDDELESKRTEMVKWWAGVMEEAPSYSEPDRDGDEAEVAKKATASRPSPSESFEEVDKVPQTTEAFTGTVTEHGVKQAAESAEGSSTSKRVSKFKMDRAAKKGFGGMFAARHGIPMG
ncbi:branched-chain-amino-acid aminotransferase, partial [Perkinsus olseni]